MAYIGVDPNLGDITFQRFTGNGNDTAFTLAQSVVSGEALIARLARHRLAVQVIGMIAIFVTAMWGMYQNLSIGALG